MGRGWGMMSGRGGVIKVGRERVLVDERRLCRLLHNLDGLKDWEPAQERKEVNISQLHTPMVHEPTATNLALDLPSAVNIFSIACFVCIIDR